MKRLALALGCLTLFLTVVGIVLSVPGWGEDFGGLAIILFLAYCGLIVTAQVTAALAGVVRALGDWQENRKRKESAKKISLR